MIVAAALLPHAAAAQPDWLPEPASGPAGADAGADDPCADPMLAPLAPAVRDTGVDRVQSACLAGSFAVRGRTAASLDGAGWGDTAVTSAALELRWLYLADLELAVGARAIEDRQEQSPAVTGDDTAYGPIHLGVAAGHAARTLGRPVRLAWSLGLDVPWTGTGDGPGPTLTASPQLAAALAIGRHLAGHARAAALLGLARPPDDLKTRRAMALSADLTWAPWHRLAAGAGIEAQSGWYGFALDHLLVRGGLRAGLGSRVRLDLAGAAPLFGREPTDLVIELGLTASR